MKRSSSRLFVTLFALSAVSSPLAVHAQEQQEAGPAEQQEIAQVDERDQSVLGFEAKYLSELQGISVDQAYDLVKLQPRIGELQGALETNGPRAFGGIMMKYQPSFTLDVLAEPKGAASVRDAIGKLGFGDLQEFVAVRETEFTERALSIAQRALGQIRDVAFTWSDIDLQTGRVIAAVQMEAHVERARAAIRQTHMGRVPPERVDVIVSETQEQDSYGGLGMDDLVFFGRGCTSGFTVLHTASGDEGIVDAGHCADKEAISHHSGTALNIAGELYADSSDAQWFRTPGFDDLKQFRYDDAGNTRFVYSRVDRANMVVNQMVCKYGKWTGPGCAFIASRSYDKDGSATRFVATFIRMDRDITEGGDSGGPWFFDTAAYGIHTGDTQCGGGVPCQSIFMAQNYLSGLGVQVRIKT